LIFGTGLVKLSNNKIKEKTMDIPDQPIRQLPGIGKLIAEALRIYKKKFLVFLSLTAIPLVWFLLFPILRADWLICLLVFIILELWTSASLIHVVNNREKTIGFKEAMANGWPRIISFFWVSFLTGLISIIGFVLLIIPGIIFSVWYVFSKYVFISEGLKGMAALKRSKELVRGFWWKVFWRFVGFGFIVFVVMIPVTVVMEILDSSGLMLLGEILGLVLNALIAPLGIVYGFLIYENLKRAKG